MSINFSFNSFDNSTQNNTITVNNNDIDKILELLKEVNLSSQDISELKSAIENDKEEIKTTNSLEKIGSVLSAIYQFPIQF